jgi:MFS family permease
VIRRSLAAGLATADLRRVQAGWLASALASWTFFIALAVYAYGVHGAAGVGAAAFARMVPAGIVAPIAGVLVDRMRRRDILIATLVLRTVLASALATEVAVGAAFGVVLATAALLTIVMTAHRPAQAAMLLDLADDPVQLGAANALWTGIDSAAFLLGSLLAGALIATTDGRTAFATCAALYLLALVPTVGVRRDDVPGHRTREPWANPLAATADGVRRVVAEPRVRSIIGFLGLATLVEGVVDVLVVVLAIRVLDLGNAGVGWLNAAWGLGGLVAGGAALALLGSGRLSAGIAAGGMLAGVSFAVAGLAASPPVAVIMLGVLGVGYGLIETAGLSLLQRLNADDVVGRAFAVVEASYWLATGVGAVVAPLLVDWLGPRAATVATGAVLPLTVILLWRRLARFERAAVVPQQVFVLVRRLSVFAPLPLVTVENVACRVTQRPVRAGEVIVRHGDPGEEFYVIADGLFDISDYHERPPPLTHGDFFGEIALLHSTTRVATVTARTDGLLYVLDRVGFLTAIGTHPASTDAAEQIATARLDELSQDESARETKVIK